MIGVSRQRIWPYEKDKLLSVILGGKYAGKKKNSEPLHQDFMRETKQSKANPHQLLRLQSP
jgi:hypothetical protein